jgi:hypothetical protein
LEDHVNTSGFTKNGKFAGIIGALLVAVAFGAAGCGGGEEPDATVAAAPENPASAGASPAPSNSGNPVAYAQCMRRNGVSNFPDPGSDGGIKFGSKENVDPNSSAFKTANEKCREYLPQGEKNVNPGQDPWSTDLKLQYAKCMRENGVPSFPDPNQEGMFPQLERGGAIDPDSAQFKKADTACAKHKPQNMATNSGPQGGQAG